MTNRGAGATAVLNLLLIAVSAAFVWNGETPPALVSLGALAAWNVVVLAVCFWEMANRERA